MVIFWGNSHQRGQNRIYIFLQFKTEIRHKSHYQKFSCEIAKLNGSMCIYTFKARLPCQHRECSSFAAIKHKIRTCDHCLRAT